MFFTARFFAKCPLRAIAETYVLFRSSLPYDAADASGRTQRRHFHPPGVDMSKPSIRIGYILLAILVCCAVLARVELSASPRAADSPGYWGVDTANLDRTRKPGDDFFQFAMGGWMKSNPIPPEYSTWGSFTVLADKNQQAIRQILEKPLGARKATPWCARKFARFGSDAHGP
jgi:Peptidase family M13